MMNYWLLILLCAVPLLHAAEPFRLELEPQTCVTTAQDLVCHIELTVQVHGGVAGQVCLQVSDLPTRCWWHQPMAPTPQRLEINSDVDLPILLKADDGRELQRSNLQLMRFQSSKKRHKRGYVWSIL